MTRLNKFLASCGIASRRKCDDIIFNGLVTVNNKLVKEPGTQIDEKNDKVRYNAKIVKPEQELVHIALNKPAGIVSTSMDEKGRKTILDLVPNEGRVFPVGRLDINSSGLILLTNDGDFTYHLTHPSKEVKKIYRAQLDKKISNSDMEKFRKGIYIDGYKTAKAQIEHFYEQNNLNRVEIIIHEGRNRQIRKMMEVLGYKVLKLTRIQIGSLSLFGLKPGEWRYLTDKEVEALKK